MRVCAILFNTARWGAFLFIFIAPYLALRLPGVSQTLGRAIANQLGLHMNREISQPPKWLVRLGQFALPGTVLLAVDLIYEQTLLTWSQGAQMVGFTLSHFFGPLIWLSLAMCYAFLLGVCLLVLLRWLQRRQVPQIPWALVVILSISLCTTYIPYRVWKHVTITLKGPGPQAAQSLVYAAHDGDRAAVELLLNHGVSVDIDNRGSTALNGACAGGQLEIARFLLSKGADIQRAPNCKDISLDRAP